MDGSVAAGVGGDASPAAGISVGAVLLGLFPSCPGRVEADVGVRRGRGSSLPPFPLAKVLPALIWEREGSLESVTQGSGPASSCTVCACSQGHPSWRWSLLSPGCALHEHTEAQTMPL